MKKKLLVLMLSAFAIGTVSMSAQTQQCDPQQKEVKCCKGEGKGDAKCAKGKKGHGPRFNLFEGIQLTPEQKTQLDALKAQRKAKHEGDRKDMKEARQKERAEYASQVEKILTPEQFAQFKANCEKKKDGLKGKKMKHHKKGEKK